MARGKAKVAVAPGSMTPVPVRQAMVASVRISSSTRTLKRTGVVPGLVMSQAICSPLAHIPGDCGAQEQGREGNAAEFNFEGLCAMGGTF